MIETEEGDRQEAALAAPMATCRDASPALQVAAPPEDEKYDGPVVRCEQCQARVPASLMVHHSKVVHQRHPSTLGDPDRGTTGSRFGQRNRGQVTVSPAPSRVSGPEGVKQHHLRCSPRVDARDATSSSPRTVSLQLDWDLDDEDEVSTSPSTPQPHALPQQYLGECGQRDSWSQAPLPRSHGLRHSRGGLAGEEGRAASLALGPPDPHSSGGVGREQAASRSACCQPARQPCASGCLQPSPSWARRHHLDHHHHHLHHHHHPGHASHPAGRRMRRGSSCGPGYPGEEETGRHSRSPESPCLPSPASHAWPAPLTEQPYSPAVQREAAGGWGPASPSVGGEAGWGEEEDRYSAKRRQLAARAEQLQRAEEMVKQQEEEAQQRTWLALQQQEMLLREKEEALKMREAAAQRKLELAARLMEESRMMRGSGRHGGDAPAPPLYCPRRPPSPCPPPCPEDLSHQEAPRIPACHGPDAPSPHDGTFHNGCQDSQAGVGRGRACPPGHGKVGDQCPRGASPRQQWRPGEDRPPSPRAVIPAHTQTESGVAVTTTTTTPCGHLPEARQGRDVPQEQEESPPRLPAPRVVRTYSRTGRTRLLSDTAWPAPASQAGQDADATLGETVVNQGSTITITPLPRPPSRPCRSYSALPMLQTTSLPRTPGASPSLTVTLASPSLSPAVTAPSPASTPPPRELGPRQLSFLPPLSLGSQQFTLKYVGTFKPTPTTRVKATPSPPRLSEAFCKPGREVVAPKVTILPRGAPVAPPTAAHSDKGLQATQTGWMQGVTDTNSPVPLLTTSPPQPLPCTTQTTVQVDPADSSTLQIHVDSPFHPPQPCHTHLSTTFLTTAPGTTIPQCIMPVSTTPTTTTPPDTQSTSEEDRTCSITPPQQGTAEGTQDHKDSQAQQHLEIDTADNTAEDTGEEPYPSQTPQDIMREPGAFEGEFDPCTVPYGSPTLMQTILGDAVAFHTPIPSPNTLQDSQNSTTLSVDAEKDSTLLYPSQGSTEDQTLQDFKDALPPSLPAGKDNIADPPEDTKEHQTVHGGSLSPANGEDTREDNEDSFSPPAGGDAPPHTQPTQHIFTHIQSKQGETEVEEVGEMEIMEESVISTQPLHHPPTSPAQVPVEEVVEEDDDDENDDLSYPEDVEMEEVAIMGNGEEPDDTGSLFIANPAQAEVEVEGSVLSDQAQVEEVEANSVLSTPAQIEAEVEGNIVLSTPIQTEVEVEGCDLSNQAQTEVEVEGCVLSNQLQTEVEVNSVFSSPAQTEVEVEGYILTNPTQPATDSDISSPTHTPAEETGSVIHPTSEAVTDANSSDIFLPDPTPEAGEETRESNFTDPAAEGVEARGVQQLGCDWGGPQSEGEVLEAKGTAGLEEQGKDKMPGTEAFEGHITNTDLVSSGSGHTHQAEDEVTQAGLMDGQVPDVPSECQNESIGSASQGATDCSVMPTTTPWHSTEGTPVEGQNTTVPVSQEGHTTPECDADDPVTPEPEEMEAVGWGRAQRRRRGRGRGRGKVRGQGMWTRRRNTGRTRPGQVDDTDLTLQESGAAVTSCATLCVTPSSCGSDDKATECPKTELQVPMSPTQEMDESTLDVEAASPLPPDTEVEDSHRNPGAEEAVEHVSRGGRKVRLREWWTGVVSEATTPRSKAAAKSPVTSPARSPARSPGRSPGPRKPRVKRSLMEASEASLPKRRCEEAPTEVDMLTTTTTTTATTTTTITTTTTTTTTNTTAATTTPTTTTATPDVLKTESFTPSTPLTPAPKALEEPLTPTPTHTPSSDTSMSSKRRRGRQPKKQRPVKEYQPSPKEKREDVECGKCGEMCFSQAHFLSHARRMHNGLARPQGASQEFTAAETQEILVDTMRAVRQVRCEVCGSVFRSVLGHRMHSLACGVDPSQLNKTCHVCHRRIRYYYLEAHLRKHAALDSRKAKEAAPKERERGSRKAALNCNMRLQAWRHTRTDDDASDTGSDQGDDFRQELRLAHYYTRPDSTLPPSLLASWEAALEEGEGAACHHQGCSHSAASVAEARQHHWLCPQGCRSHGYSCKLCSFTCDQEGDMEDHLTSMHMSEVAGEPDSESDASDEDWGERQGGQRSGGLRRYSKDLLVPFLPALRWTHDFLTDSVSDSLYPEHWPTKDGWQALPPATAAPYLPAVTTSPRFRVQVVGQQAVAEDGWEELHRFDSTAAGQGSAMFCGGPVTASAWCPECPPGSLASNMQHLALATLSSPDMKHQICHSYSHRGLIQLWGCPGPATREPPTPRFLLGLGHQHGTVWSLAWCPSGSEEAAPPGLGESPLPRLGLLAAACSDGTVQVYAVPRPEVLLPQGRVYRPPASLALVPGHGEGREVQCLKVDWCRAKGHHLVAGALSSGVVCVWDLTTTSPFLRLQQGSVVLPFRAFHAHNGVCTTVAFCPTTGGRNLLSGGNDRTYKFWDLEHPELPLSVVRKGLVLDSLWLPHWAGCFLAFDDVYGLASTNTCFKESGFFGIAPRNVLSANAAVWTLAGSDWLNSVAQGDSAGEVTLTVQQQLFRNYENEKFLSKRKVPVMCARLQALDATAPVSFSSSRVIQRARHPLHKAKAKAPDQQRQQAQQEEDDCLGQNLYQEFPQTYQETRDTHGLVFKEQNVANFSSIPKEELLERWRNECMEASAITCYPMMAVTSLAWNNNLGAHTWIAVATQSGLVRLVRVEALHTAAMDSFIHDNFGVRR
ncbi:uncharacterized protein LOC135094008 isoform X3 [Scylla paramamosain]|uniref:uncharacterized protein LOC135094008 isoform X3 n=1 Tax=Scylla paramamosain TaxID=85552 RepID=UPI0030838AF0